MEKKRSVLKTVLCVAGCVLAALIAFAVLGLCYLTIREFRPKDKMDVPGVFPLESSVSEVSLEKGKDLRLVTWNIGYGALGSKADFFLDGGSSVFTATKKEVEWNMENIAASLKDLNPDIFFLQEIDSDSTRSHKVDEQLVMRQAFPSYYSSFAANYKVDFIPYPMPPLGKVNAGIMTLSRYGLSSGERIQLPCPFKWPVKTINLKRCLLVNRIPVSGTNSALVLVNLHLEAYDSGEGKIAQTKMLKDFLEAEVSKGNYVIAGGDFNQTFSGTKVPFVLDGMWKPGLIDESEFSTDLAFIMDSDVPSCRSLDKAYAGQSREDFQFYNLDGFIISKNITIKSAGIHDYDFTWTDHNPLVVDFVLN